jgi:hypothetical protein
VSELERCVERADLDPAVHVILLAGNDGPQRARLHVAISLLEAGGLQGARVLHCGWNRHGVV